MTGSMNDKKFDQGQAARGMANVNKLTIIIIG